MNTFPAEEAIVAKDDHKSLVYKYYSKQNWTLNSTKF